MCTEHTVTKGSSHWGAVEGEIFLVHTAQIKKGLTPSVCDCLYVCVWVCWIGLVHHIIALQEYMVKGRLLLFQWTATITALSFTFLSFLDFIGLLSIFLYFPSEAYKCKLSADLLKEVWVC